jgi:hypothetical protein
MHDHGWSRDRRPWPCGSTCADQCRSESSA